MARSAASASRSVRKNGPLKTTYLVAYNLASLVAWMTVLGRVAATLGMRGPVFVYSAAGEWTKWTQTLALMEVVHAITGIVRTSPLTTLMQVASRILLVWGVVDLYPFLARNLPYSTMLLAWSATEVIRYGYFVMSLLGSEPSFVVWLRYSTFYVLYPIGILSECSMIKDAIVPARAIGPVPPAVYYAILAIYVPGSYILYTHMMSQRKKVLARLAQVDIKNE
ncbi:putative very-long-chain (3R)-3-hydroxyacyl-[acyl-carrier protein] dehydratase [Ceratocystis platani]|uniref:Very-long-chain (3R)-3-hydroxyacyl-CoA dehydratase n=1 Tax=Ceratocystis fimbriata f. sp. platani TaxID=88771 RepID=A0A0F8CV53_CERFI|nr:putative very-long-chain (3R)-3-hydroxyacyl-[acyl-carrier protein] dehydratase [Ceratocystis platani]